MIIGNFDNNGLAHSYPNLPPEISEPEILYKYHYEGWVTPTTQSPSIINQYIWNIEQPFYIISGQNTTEITVKLMPIYSDSSNVGYCDISLKLGKWYEEKRIFFKKGPQWNIQGNNNPIIKYIGNKLIETIETYTLNPLYDQTGNPPKNSTLPDSYTLKIKGGKILKFYGENPPYGIPKIDVNWYDTNDNYLCFYSSWINDNTTFPNIIKINPSIIQEEKIIIEKNISTTGITLWYNEERPITNLYTTIKVKEQPQTEFILEKNLKEIKYTNLPISWDIIGNKTPKIIIKDNIYTLNTEIYTLLPKYNTPYNNTTPDKFIFSIEKGKILNFGRINNIPTIEILWYQTGYTQFKFSTEINNIQIPSSKVDLYITNDIIITYIITEIPTIKKSLWSHEQRPK
jgi:hypothetical protein